MKYVFASCIGILWLVCMVFGTAEVWHQGWGEVLLLWFTLSLLCALFLGICLAMCGAVNALFMKLR